MAQTGKTELPARFSQQASECLTPVSRLGRRRISTMRLTSAGCRTSASHKGQNPSLQTSTVGRLSTAKLPSRVPWVRGTLSLGGWSVTWTAFHYHTLHRQPIPLSDMAILYAVLCWTISDCPTKQFKVRLCIRPCARMSLLFYAQVAKILEHSRSLKVYCQSNESDLI